LKKVEPLKAQGEEDGKKKAAVGRHFRRFGRNESSITKPPRREGLGGKNSKVNLVRRTRGEGDI